MASQKLKQILETIPTGLVKELVVRMKTLVFKHNDETDTNDAILTAYDGKTFELKEPVSFDALYYYRGEPEYDTASLCHMTAETLNMLAAKLIAKDPHELKLQFDEAGKVISVRSKRAKQINWRSAMGSVFKGIEDTYELAPNDIEIKGTRSYLIKLPIESKILGFYCEIWSGSNIGREHARTIELRIKGRTIAALKGMEAPCLNWCTFKGAKHWFDVNTAHINDVTKLAKLNFKTIHTAMGEERLAKIGDVFKAQKASVTEAATLIDKYVHTGLDKNEMDTIVKVYVEKFKLPKYVAKDIPDLIKEPTVWGLSNAFSFFRTHCNYKRADPKTKDTSTLTHSLERIAGELIVVSPLIKELKEKAGKITRKVLLPNEEPKKALPIKPPTKPTTPTLVEKREEKTTAKPAAKKLKKATPAVGKAAP